MNRESNPNEIEIVWLRRISQSQPTAWEGRTRNHQAVHIFYKYGRFEVWLRCPANAGTGAFRWMTIVSFYPEWLETEIEIERDWAGSRRNGSRANAQREAWLLFERKMLAEMRASDSGRLEEFGRPRGRVITVGQLAHWLALRNQKMAPGHAIGSNGIRVELTAWTEES